jgi:hypothetical protein
VGSSMGVAARDTAFVRRGCCGWVEVVEAELKFGSSMWPRKGLLSARRGWVALDYRRDHWEASFVDRRER